MKRRWWRTLSTGLLVVGLVAGVWWAARSLDWSQALPMVTAHAVPYLLAACVCNIVALLCAMLAWRGVVADLGHRVPVAVASRIYFASVVAKFVPGRVWAVLTQVRLAGDAGVTAVVTVTAFLLNMVVVLLTGFAVGAVAAPTLLGDGVWWLLVPAALLVFLLVRPSAVGVLAGIAARLVKREPPTARTGPDTRASIGWQVLCWLVSGLHLWVLMLAMGAPVLSSLPAGVGGFALATVLSTLVVVVPDGVVVREVLIVAALAPVLPLAVAGTVAIASRAVCLITELAVAAVALLGTQFGKWGRQVSPEVRNR